MARPQVREVSAPSAIQGVAAPVPTYVRPADPGRSSLHDLAEGLAAFDAGLGTFLNKRKAEGEEADKARAEIDFVRNNQMSFAEAQRRGLIPASASPVYQEWYKKSQGDLAGIKLRDKFALDYQQWEGRDGADQEAFAKWYSQWVAQNVGDEQDPRVLAGLAPHISKLTDEGYSVFSKERDDRLVEGARATSGALITHALEDTLDDGRTTGNTDWDAFWTRTLELRDEAISRGEKSADYDQLIVDSILLQAERSADMDVLKLLDKTLPGSEHPMNYDPKVREALTKAQDRIRAAQGSMASDIARERERVEKQQQEELWAETLDRIHKGEEVPEEFIVRLSRRDGEARAKVARYQKEAVELGTQEDPEALLELYTEIDQGAGVDYVLSMREKGVIRDPSTLTKALDRVKAVKAASGDGGIFTSPSYKDIVKRVTSDTGAGPFNPLTNERGLSDEGAEALFDYRQMLLDWEAKNPNSSMLEKEKAAREIGQIIQERIVPNEGGDGQYVSPSERAELERRAEEEQSAMPEDATTEEANPFGGYSFLPNPISSFVEWWNGPHQPSQGAQEAPQVAPEPEVEQSPAPALETLSESRRSAVESLAQKRGISVEEANQRLHDKLQELMGSDGVDPVTTESIPAPEAAISQESRDKLAALFQDPPKAERLAASNVPVAPILSLIGKTEGTDRRDGYNETLGYGAYTGGRVNLVGMTLDEIDALQTRMLRHKDNSWNSSAVGRYQIVRTTLRDLRKELGLKGNERYDEKMQDRLALALLERRGLSKWQAGQMSDEKFMDNLSAEWASLPKSSGKGTYKGQRVGTSAAGLKSTLSKVRGVQVASLDPNAGMESYTPPAYAKIPAKDARGEDQVAKFLEWNPDPVGNHEKHLSEVKPELADVVRKAQELSGVKFVVGSGKRDKDLQKKAVEWGWSRTEDSDHLHGDAVDLWPIDKDGAVVFDKKMQAQVVKAMKQAAKELGVELDIGADWKSFKDLPHFGLKKGKKV